MAPGSVNDRAQLIQLLSHCGHTYPSETQPLSHWTSGLTAQQGSTLSLKLNIKDKSDFHKRQEIVLFKILFKAKGNSRNTQKQRAPRLAERGGRARKDSQVGVRGELKPTLGATFIIMTVLTIGANRNPERHNPEFCNLKC